MWHTISANQQEDAGEYPWIVRREDQSTAEAAKVKSFIASQVRMKFGTSEEEGLPCGVMTLRTQCQPLAIHVKEPNPAVCVVAEYPRGGKLTVGLKYAQGKFWLHSDTPGCGYFILKADAIYVAENGVVLGENPAKTLNE